MDTAKAPPGTSPEGQAVANALQELDKRLEEYRTAWDRKAKEQPGGYDRLALRERGQMGMTIASDCSIFALAALAWTFGPAASVKKLADIETVRRPDVDELKRLHQILGDQIERIELLRNKAREALARHGVS